METKTTTTEKLKIFVDASSLKDSSCLRRLVYNNFYGFTNRQRHQNYQAGYGSAVHKALEYWYSTEVKIKEVEGIAIQKASDYYKPFTPFISQKEYEFRTPSHLVKTLESYFRVYNQDAETLKPIKGILTPGLLESKFTYPAVLLSDAFYSEHFDLVVAGTVDMIAAHYGQECFVDHKSTATKWGYKDAFFMDFDLNVQMMKYTYMIKKLTGQTFPFIVNGVFLKGTTQKSEKAGIFDGVNLERYGPKSYTEKQMNQFECWLFDKLRDFHAWLEDYFTRNPEYNKDPSLITEPNLAACHPKFPCPYYKICSQSPELQGRILDLTDRQEYNPLAFAD